MKTTTESPYEVQAIEFLDKFNIEFETVFTGYRKHFIDDKKKRGTYEVTFLKRTYPIKTLEIAFGQSITNSEKKKAPTAYDVLACLTKSDPGTFDDFCGEYGYNNDSRKAFKVWESVAEEWQKVKTFFSKSELNELMEIQ